MNKASLLANALVNSGALRFGAFTLRSGHISPFYIDLASLLSSPRDFKCAVNVVADEVKGIISSTKIDKLASIELKGALILPSVAAEVNLPCLVVRKETKEYGVTGRIAGGEVKKGERILFIDDVVTDGKSKLEGVKPLKQSGAKVDTILVVIDREQGGRQNLEKLGYRFRAVTTLSEIVKNLANSSRISQEQAKTILSYIRMEKTALSSEGLTPEEKVNLAVKMTDTCIRICAETIKNRNSNISAAQLEKELKRNFANKKHRIRRLDSKFGIKQLRNLRLKNRKESIVRLF